jgi:hypothetical protein
LSTELGAHDPNKPGAYSDLLPITTREFFQGSSAEFKLEVLKRYKQMKFEEWDPTDVELTLDDVQMALDILGMLPFVGLPFNVASGFVSSARGDVLGACLSFAAAAAQIGGLGAAGVAAKRAALAIDAAADAVKVSGGAAALAQEIRAIANVENAVAEAGEKALLNIDKAIRAGYMTEQQATLALIREGKLAPEQAKALLRDARTVGETASTTIGKDVHKAIAEARRASGDFDLVQAPIKDKGGKPILVSRRVNLQTGAPIPDAPLQQAVPDAVSYKWQVVIDDKPLGRPIAKDRQEMIRNITAYEQREGRLPRTVAVTRYDPDTGEQLFTELYSPFDFLPTGGAP